MSEISTKADQRYARLNLELRAEMARLGLSVKGLAQEMGISRHTLSNRLHGKSEFTVRELYRLGEAMHADISFLIMLSEGNPDLREEEKSDAQQLLDHRASCLQCSCLNDARDHLARIRRGKAA